MMEAEKYPEKKCKPNELAYDTLSKSVRMFVLRHKSNYKIVSLLLTSQFHFNDCFSYFVLYIHCRWHAIAMTGHDVSNEKYYFNSYSYFNMKVRKNQPRKYNLLLK